MKTLFLALLFLLAGLTSLRGQEVPQPDQHESVYVQVDYMKPNAIPADAYVNMEREIWKPIHRERIKAGEILGWYLFALQYPGGSGQDYNYMTVTIFSRELGVDEPTIAFEDIIRNVHPDKTPSQVEANAELVRKLIKSEVWKSTYQLLPGSSTTPSAILVDYMHIDAVKEPDYLRLEREVWQPVHQLRLEEGLIKNWTLYSLEFPDESNYPYSHATATVFDDWSLIKDSWPEDAFRKVHDDGKEDALVKLTYETRDLVNSEIWVLVDSVTAMEQ